MGISITDVLGGSALTAVKDIIGQFHLSPDKKAEMQAAVDANAAVLAQKQLEYDQKLVDVAGQNIRADASSGDKYTSRARPSFIYVMLAIFICNYMLFPLIHYAPLQFPDALFWLFGSCMLGYTGARSWDKYAAMTAQASPK